MKVSNVFSDVVTYISEAVGRIFSLVDDEYPNTGVQPFEGEPADKKSKSANR